MLAAFCSSQRIKNSIVARRPIMSGNQSKNPDIEAFFKLEYEF